MVAFLLESAGMITDSISIYRQILAARPGEPQSLRDLALALGRAGNPEEAIKLLNDILHKDWDVHFRQVLFLKSFANSQFLL